MTRFTPLNVAKHQLNNRLVVPPMASQTATTDALPPKPPFNTMTNWRNRVQVL